jgi:hypothetical protein
MEDVRSALALTAGILLLAHCHKTPAPAPESEDAGVAASPPPSPVSAPAMLTGFEGEIDLLAKGADASKPPQELSLLVKNDRVRVDAPPGSEASKAVGGRAFVLLRVPEKKLDVVVETSRQVVELDLNNTEHLKSLAKSANPGGARPNPKAEPHAPPDPPKVTKTGQKEMIAGYSCEDWDITSARDGRKKASLCVAEVGVSFFHLPLTGVPAEYSFALELVDGQHFPLRIVGYDEKTGAESGRVEVTKFQRHPIEASLFEIPPGYTTVDALQMIAALAGGGRVPGMPSGIPGMPPGMPSGIPGMPPGFPASPGHRKHH